MLNSKYETIRNFKFTYLLYQKIYGHASWTHLQKRWFCYAFFIFTPFKCWYLSQMDRYCHESSLILKLIKGTTTPVNMRSIAFQMGAGCVLEWRMVRVVEGGEAEGGGKRYTQTLWENGVSRAFRKLNLNNFANLGATDLIFVSFCS